MAIVKIRTILGASILLFGFQCAKAAPISFVDFSDISSLTLNGSATQAGNALRLVSTSRVEAGSTFLTDAIDLSDDGGSFSTNFSFQITNSGGGTSGGADGLTFTLQGNDPTAIGSTGGFLGYAGIGGSSPYQDIIGKSVAIEFDTYKNSNVTPGPANNDISANHVGIDVNGDWNSVAQANVAESLKGGDIFHAWIDYDGLSDILEVRLSTGIIRPADIILSHALDIPSILGRTSGFMGFTAGTGGEYGNHDILAWDINPPPVSPVPVPPAVWLFGTGILGLIGFSKRRKVA